MDALDCQAGLWLGSCHFLEKDEGEATGLLVGYRESQGLSDSLAKS